MGLWDSLLGRSKPVEANLDVLFAVPQAALTLQAGGGFMPLGTGAVCYRANEGAAFSATQSDVQELLDADGGPAIERTTDSFGFTWLLDRHEAEDLSGLVTELHAINTSLAEAGFGQSLLCSLIGFKAPSGAPLALVYLYKRGTFYPFAPQGDERRDNSLELQVRGLISEDVPIEPELGRWLGVWGAPGLD